MKDLVYNQVDYCHQSYQGDYNINKVLLLPQVVVKTVSGRSRHGRQQET